jgi:hypothetical protein
MVTIAWNPLEFPLIVALPKGRTSNAEYYRDNILTALIQLQPEDDPVWIEPLKSLKYFNRRQS